MSRALMFPATAAALPARTHTLLYNSIMASVEVCVPPLLNLAACALVGREAEVSKPGAVPMKLVEYQAAATATHCPRCAHRGAHNGGKDYTRCRFGHDTGVYDAQTTCRIARLGHTDCLLEAVRAGAQWHPGTTRVAARGGHTECMLAAVRAGAPWDLWTTWVAAAGGHTECMLAAARAGAPWHEETTWAAARDGRLECLRGAHEHGALWHPQTTAIVATAPCRAYCRAHDPALVRDCGCPGARVRE